MSSILLPSIYVKSAILFCCALAAIPVAALWAAEPAAQVLPFAPEVISRLSLDGKPRSLAIRQGTDVWLGYDLQRATIQKAWRAPPAKPGLIKSGFTTRSTGITWFEDSSDAAWELRRDETTVPLSVRYLGCSQRTDHIELRWELRSAAGAPAGDALEGRTLRLFERVPLAAAPVADRLVRELRVETLSPDELLLPPSTVRKAWKITTELSATDSAVPAPGSTGLRGNPWHRLTLP